MRVETLVSSQPSRLPVEHVFLIVSYSRCKYKSGVVLDIIRGIMDLVDVVKRSERRSIAIVVAPDGLVTVRAPKHATDAMIEKFVFSKRDWIEKTRAKALRTYVPKPKTNAFESGLVLFGERVQVKKVLSKTLRYDASANFIQLPTMPQKEGIAALESLYKKIARDHLGARLAQLAKQLGYNVKTFRLSSAKTRWGSCSTRGTISLHWKLILAPKAVADYVIIHELSHLDHMDHSKAFWDKVSKNFPGYERHRAWLKKNGKTLTLEGIQFK